MEIPIIITNRCVLDGILKKNYADFFSILKDKRIECNLHEFCGLFNSLEDVEEIIGIFLGLMRKGISCLWGIYVNDNLIGFIGLLDIPSDTTVFYGLRHEHRGLGIMTECVVALCQYMSKHEMSPYVYSHVLNSNTASIRVLEKCGFKVNDIYENKIILKKSLV